MRRVHHISTKVKRTIKCTFIGLLIAVTISIVVLLLCVRYIGINGYTIRVIASGSMEPTLRQNSIVVIQNCKTKDIHIKDIVCFYDETINSDVIHRVIGIETKDGEVYLVTKGDNNKLEDTNRVTDDNIIGTVVKIILS